MLFISVILFLASGKVHGAYESSFQINPEETNNVFDFNTDIDNNIDSPNPPDIDSLQYVIVMTRHGSRTPLYTYPNDPYPYTNRTLWPEGPEELTRFGKQQLFESGRLLRDRYWKFLNEYYRPEDNYILTNRYNRDFMSAACLLAGLYPPKGYQIWNPFINWQPIPIWEDAFDIADILSNSTLCPRFYQEMGIAMYQLIENDEKQSELLNYLTLHMGKEIKSVTEIIGVWDSLHLQQQNGYELPDWTKAVYPGKLSPWHSLTMKTSVAGTPEMIRLSAGPILQKIFDRLSNKAQGKTHPQERLNINAVHDLTLQALFSALGFESTFSIDTSAFMIFELHRAPTSDFTVQFYYYNNSAHFVPNVLDPPKCPKPCPLEKFHDLVTNLNPEDWEAECHSELDYDNTFHTEK